MQMRRPQVGFKQLYNPVPQTVRVSWSQLVGVRVAVRCSENQLPAEGLGPQDPRLSSPAEWEKKCCYSQRNWGSIYCSLFSLQLTSHDTTLSQPFWIKCERYIFLKNCVRSFIIVDYVSACICIRIVVSRLFNSRHKSELHWNKQIELYRSLIPKPSLSKNNNDTPLLVRE